MAASGAAIRWTDTAMSLRGNDGQQFSFDCPARGRLSTVWGTDTYTDDSSLCSAAVHAGFITPAVGGTITIEIAPGEPSYVASARNGVSTAAWGSWTGSFVVVAGSPFPAPALAAGATPIDWSDDARAFQGIAGAVTVDCPAGGSAGSVWGSGLYTDDSSICTAAVHAGVITMAAGGSFDIELRPGEPSYPATTSNGVTTASWGAWSGSFVVLGGFAPPPAPVMAGPRPISWTDSAVSYRGRLGRRFDVDCPAGGSAATVWGSGTYTDDSSICTAAVHAGLISFAAGGPVTIEITAGQAKYPAVTRRGVATSAWGVWHGSYVFR